MLSATLESQLPEYSPYQLKKDSQLIVNGVWAIFFSALPLNALHKVLI